MKHLQEERVLFHYNGHGVPRPTVNGEVWVFNKVNYSLCVVLTEQAFVHVKIY